MPGRSGPARPRTRTAHRPRWTLALLLGLPVLLSCSDDGPSEPGGVVMLVFSSEVLALGEDRGGLLTLSNAGDRSVGPVEILASPVRDGDGNPVPASEVQVSPSTIADLPAGSSTLLHVDLVLPDDLDEGTYEATVEARVQGVGGDPVSRAAVSFTVSDTPPPTDDEVGITIAGGPAAFRQGDVVVFRVETEDGEPVEDALVRWAVLPSDGGLFGEEGRFVAYASGDLRIVATSGEAADTLPVVVAPRGLDGSFSVVGRGEVRTRTTSDLWVHSAVAYTGTLGRTTPEAGAVQGNTLFVWNVTDPATPIRADSVQIDAGRLNDVKVSADGALAIITHEGSSDQRNGVTLLDLASPLNPRVITRFTEGLEGGVHNVWIDGDHLYATAGSGIQVMDISSPSAPQVLSTFYAGSSFAHDVYVRDGLAFVSHWNAGLVILDVGNGAAGGSPSNPVELGRVVTRGGRTHNAWYWPEAGYVFVGEENFGSPGVMHVVDARDLSNPREVATFAVPGQPPHNFWLDEARGILYAAWYGNGVRAVDVTGDLLGELERQGREMASLEYGGGGCEANGTSAWAPQLHGGLVYVSDMDCGLVVLSPEF